MTTYYPGDRVRVTYETTVDEDGHYFGAGFAEEVHQNQTVEIIERHNPRTTEPVGTVVKLDRDIPDYDGPLYVVKLSRDVWADLHPGDAVHTFRDKDNRDAEYVGHVSQLEWPDGYVFVGTTDKPIDWSESATEDTDVSSVSYVRYWRRPDETEPGFRADPGDRMFGWEIERERLVECDADGWAYRQDTNGTILASRGNEHIFWDDYYWGTDDEPTLYEPHTPVTPADLTQAQRDGEKK